MSINTPRTCDALGVCQGRTPPCQHTCQHPGTAQGGHGVNTAHLQPGGFYFAPGAIEHGPRRSKRLAPWQRLVLDCAAVLAIAGLLGFCAGYLQVMGWPL